MPIVAAAATALSLNCWAAAAYRYHLPVELLYSVGQVESGHRIAAVGANKDGSEDLGVMQINSRWLPVLAGYGITRQDLLRDPCKNIQVGAWILAQEVQRAGYSWHAIGAYNAGPIAATASPSTRLRKLATYRAYSEKVIARWKQLRASRSRVGTAASAPGLGHVDR